MEILSAEEFAKEVSPLNDCGVRASLEKMHLQKHIYEWMHRYAKYLLEKQAEFIQQNWSTKSIIEASNEFIKQLK